MFLTSIALATCPEPTNNAELHGSIDGANSAYAALDEGGFEERLAVLEAQVGCLSEVIGPHYAAAVHRTRGIGAFLRKDFGGAELHFAAARRIDPDYRFPEAIAPPGNPLNTRYDAIDLSVATPETVPTPVKGAYRLDGRLATQRDPRLPVLLQRLDGADVVVSTLFLEAGEALPPQGERIRSRRRAPVFAIAGIGALVGAGACLGGAYSSMASFDDAATKGDVDRIRATYRANRSWNVASGVLALAGAGLMTAEFVVR